MCDGVGTLYVPATSWCAIASNKQLPLAVVSIIRYPGKHDSASQESLLSLFCPPSLLANALKIDNCRFIVQRYNNHGLHGAGTVLTAGDMAKFDPSQNQNPVTGVKA